jgi:hypothetical protein
MSALADGLRLRPAAFGQLTPVGRAGGQGRVFVPARIPSELGRGPVVVKLYRRPPPAQAARALAEMVTWSHSLSAGLYARLHDVAAWPVAVVSAGSTALGVVMRDQGPRFSVSFAMPSGRRSAVLLSLEHLLGSDFFLQQRGLGVTLDTVTRARVAERVSDALAFLHREAIVVSDIAPSNLLVGFGPTGPSVCFIDCDSMVFQGRRALAAVQTGDWQLPAAFGESPHTRAADAYKLGLVILRLFARSHDARRLDDHRAHVPRPLRELVERSLDPDAANRPPAGEWQRALCEALATGGLDQRYPGPAPAAPMAPPAHWGARNGVAAPVAAWPVAGGLGARAGGSAATPPRVAAVGHRYGLPQAPARPARRSRPARQLATAVWLIVAVIVFTLILARLIAAAVPSPDASGFGSGFDSGSAQRAFPSRGNAQGVYPYYYEYAPAGPGNGGRLP